jgi:hypothetical protein
MGVSGVGVSIEPIRPTLDLHGPQPSWRNMGMTIHAGPAIFMARNRHGDTGVYQGSWTVLLY